jgi:hypothetical protein
MAYAIKYIVFYSFLDKVIAVFFFEMHKIEHLIVVCTG